MNTRRALLLLSGALAPCGCSSDASGIDGSVDVAHAVDVPDAAPPTLVCNASSVAAVADVQIGQVVVAGSLEYAVGRDAVGFYAISLVAPQGQCIAQCNGGSPESFTDPCHFAAWDIDGNELPHGRDEGPLPHLAIQFVGHGPSAMVLVEITPRVVTVDPSVRFPPPT